jgi:hypothetical protein
MEDRSREVGVPDRGSRAPAHRTESTGRARDQEHRRSNGATEAAKNGERERNAAAEHGEERRRRARRGTPPPETETPRAGSGSRRTERRGHGSERALGLGLHSDGVRVFAQGK